jgi:NAD(P)-dependent dehydrogenase (short-subunit alcohol dehydrogenase family)
MVGCGAGQAAAPSVATATAQPGGRAARTEETAIQNSEQEPRPAVSSDSRPGQPRTAPPDCQLAGTSVVVTGAAQGIGLACAAEFARAGAAVLMLDRNAHGLHQARESLAAVASVASEVADVTDSQAMHRCAVLADQRLGRLAVWVNNAGVVARGDPDCITDEDRQAAMRVNFDGTWNGSLAAYAIMKQHGRGSIVNLASISGLRVSPGRSVYGPSKAAVAALTRNLAYEWGPAGIRVNAVAPGLVDTAMTSWLTEDAEATAEAAGRIPLRRIAAPADIARVVAAISSESFGYVTGQTIVIDGGLTL